MNKVCKQWKVAKSGVSKAVSIGDGIAKILWAPLMIGLFWMVFNISVNSGITSSAIERLEKRDAIQTKEISSNKDRILVLEITNNPPKWPSNSIERPKKALKPAKPSILK